MQLAPEEPVSNDLRIPRHGLVAMFCPTATLKVHNARRHLQATLAATNDVQVSAENCDRLPDWRELAADLGDQPGKGNPVRTHKMRAHQINRKRALNTEANAQGAANNQDARDGLGKQRYAWNRGESATTSPPAPPPRM